jgi:plastocyanin
MMKSFLLIVALFATIVSSADWSVKVGSPEGTNAFEPKAFDANVGDNVIFTWVSGKHNVMQADTEETAKTCTKSAKEGVAASETYDTATAPNANYTWELKEAGELFYICTVLTHCTADGMMGSINVLEEGKTPKVTGVPAEKPESTSTSSAPASTDASSSASAASPTSSTKSSANIEKPLSIAVVGGIMLSLVNYCL